MIYSKRYREDFFFWIIILLEICFHRIIGHNNLSCTIVDIVECFVDIFFSYKRHSECYVFRKFCMKRWSIRDSEFFACPSSCESYRSLCHDMYHIWFFFPQDSWYTIRCYYRKSNLDICRKWNCQKTVCRNNHNFYIISDMMHEFFECDFCSIYLLCIGISKEEKFLFFWHSLWFFMECDDDDLALWSDAHRWSPCTHSARCIEWKVSYLSESVVHSFVDYFCQNPKWPHLSFVSVSTEFEIYSYFCDLFYLFWLMIEEYWRFFCVKIFEVFYSICDIFS